MVKSSVPETPSVSIIGGGIIGVTTGLAIQRQCPGVHVTIFSEHLSPHTTADGAAGLFSLFLLGDTPLDKQVGTYVLTILTLNTIIIFCFPNNLRVIYV